jgi:hypothetical protein
VNAPAWLHRRRGGLSPEAEAARAQKRTAREERRRIDEARRQEAQAARGQERTAREDRRRVEEARRQEVAARRKQVAGELAAAALSWGLNAWLEGAMWFCLGGGLAVNYLGSYADLAATFGAFGYDGWVRWIMPLGIDLPVTASVLAQLLAARWKSGRWVRVRLGLLTAVTAPLTLTGNALRGAIDAHGHFVHSFHVALWMDLAAFAVPGLGVVLIGYVASMMQGERAELTRRRLEAQVPTREAQEPPEVEESTPPRPRRKRSGEQPPNGRRPASEVLALVRGAREHLVTEHGREPSDNDVAALVTAGGHRISASRTRVYLAQLRAAQDGREPAEEEMA